MPVSSAVKLSNNTRSRQGLRLSQTPTPRRSARPNKYKFEKASTPSSLSEENMEDCLVAVNKLSLESPTKRVINNKENEAIDYSASGASCASPTKRPRRHTASMRDASSDSAPAPNGLTRRSTRGRATPLAVTQQPRRQAVTANKDKRPKAHVPQMARSERAVRTRAAASGTAYRGSPPPRLDVGGFERESSCSSASSTASRSPVKTRRSTRKHDAGFEQEQSSSSSESGSESDDGSSSDSEPEPGSPPAPVARGRGRPCRHSTALNATPANRHTLATKAATSVRRVGRPPRQRPPQKQQQAAAPSSPVKCSGRQGSLLCREEQHDIIRSFVCDSLLAACSRSLYISGVPGTGKTATVHQVIDELRSARHVPRFQFIEVNGMRLTDPNQVFVEIYRYVKSASDGIPVDKVSRVSVEAARRHLNSVFETDDVRRLPVVLLVDELDLLCTRRQHVLYELFEWATRDAARLLILAVANTLDLPERLLTQRVNSRMGMARLQFQPYQVREIECILQATFVAASRIAVEPKAIEFVARKVAAVSGDLRKALEICRRARDMVAHETRAKITLKTMQEAIRALACSSRNRAIVSCSEHQHLLLRAAAHLTQRTGVAECRLAHVITEYWTLCQLEGYTALNLDFISIMVGELCACSLMISSGDGSGTQSRCVSLKVPPEELLFALTEHTNN